MLKWVLVDFKRTLYDPDNGCLEPFALEFLNGLKKHKLKLVLVGKAKGNAEQRLRETGLQGFFERIFFAVEKDLGLFERIVGELALKPCECVSVGDRVKKEIRFSKQLGFKTVWLKRGKFALELPENDFEQPDFVASDLKEALAIIKSLLGKP